MAMLVQRERKININYRHIVDNMTFYAPTIKILSHVLNNEQQQVIGRL